MDPGAVWVLAMLGFGAAAGFVTGVLSLVLRIRPLIVGTVVVAAVLLDGLLRHDAFVLVFLLVGAWAWPLGSWLARTLGAASASLWNRAHPLPPSRCD